MWGGVTPTHALQRKSNLTVTSIKRSTPTEFCKKVCAEKKVAIRLCDVLKEIVFPVRICSAKYYYFPRKDVALHEVRQYSAMAFSRHIEWLKPAE